MTYYWSIHGKKEEKKSTCLLKSQIPYGRVHPGEICVVQKPQLFKG